MSDESAGDADINNIALDTFIDDQSSGEYSNDKSEEEILIDSESFVTTVESVVEKLGMGRFQIIIFIVTGVFKFI